MTRDAQPPAGDGADETDDDSASVLRRRAEEHLREGGRSLPDAAIPGDTARLLHELRVHEVELEMQNEELRRAQLELEASRARWFDLYDIAPVGYCTLSAKGLIVQANLTLTSMLGATRNDLEHRPFSRFIVEEDRDAWYRLYERILAFGSPQSCEVRMANAAKRPWTAQLTVTAATDAEGAGELRIAVTDVTARKEAEQQAMASRALLDSIIEATPSHIFAIDRGHRFTLVNTAMLRDYGLTKAQLVGGTVDDLFAPDVAAAMRVAQERIMQTGEAESQEQLLVRKSSTAARIVLVSRFPLRDARGAITGMSGVLTDVTDHRTSEAERTSLAAQLQQAHKLESIGRLAGGVAHDFNNQLGVILGHAEMAMARMDRSRPEHAELTEIRDAALRSAELTRQLLTFARRQPIQPTVLDLNKTVSRVLTMLRRLIGENIELVWQPGDALWPVTADIAQVELILANLAVNARDAIKGQGTLRVSTANVVLDEAWCATHVDAVAGEHVRIRVTDNGCGMSASVLAKIFEPFFTTKGVGEGTGLGLATVYGAVRQNGGSITVESAIGQGTTFEIHFPRAFREVTQTGDTTPSSALASGHETILLVEDEPAVRRLTGRLLEAQGYRVLSAESPRHAIQLAREHGDAIALLLSDIVMPGMEGPALAEVLVAAHPGLRHLFMSGYALHANDPEVPRVDGEHYIAKPFSLAALTAKVREVLDRA